MIFKNLDLDSYDRIELLKLIRIIIDYYEIMYCTFDLSDIDKPINTKI